MKPYNVVLVMHTIVAANDSEDAKYVALDSVLSGNAELVQTLPTEIKSLGEIPSNFSPDDVPWGEGETKTLKDLLSNDDKIINISDYIYTSNVRKKQIIFITNCKDGDFSKIKNDDVIKGKPKATPFYTCEEIENLNYVGVYMYVDLNVESLQEKLNSFYLKTNSVNTKEKISSLEEFLNNKGKTFCGAKSEEEELQLLEGEYILDLDPLLFDFSLRFI